ncbi:HlyD family efflux transporter periplasmic adaptor subunit [Aeromonas sp. MrichA-1]|nr:HlyD family efflux transporter periplasmic adaptor subunit [Aeromonas sp. MrichA-1]
MKIMPNKDELVFDIMVLNRDIVFLNIGQKTIIRINAFDLIKHGALKGKIINISGDAIQDEKLGLVFRTKVKIEKNEVEVDGLPVKINSGMSVVVEAKTGKRKIIDFFLNPARKSVSESIKER